MKLEEKNKIRQLREEGMGYKKIASEMCISVNTVKSFCRNNKLTSSDITSKSYCKECGKEIVEKKKCKKRVFCSEACKRNWWNHHKTQVRKTSLEEHLCLCCNKPFMAYPRENRKYCSHACYIKGRFDQGDYDA